MRIQKTTNHGKDRWIVDLGISEAGRRVRKFFTCRQDAECFARTRMLETRRMGSDWARRFDSLTVIQKSILIDAMDRAEKLGISIPDLVAMAEKSGKVGPGASLESVVRLFLSEKEKRGMRPRSFAKLRNSLEMFASQSVRDRQIQEISQNDVREFINSNGWASATRKSYLGDVRSLFNWAVRRGYLTGNPAELVESPLQDEKAPLILTIPKIQKLLDACQRNSPSLLAWLVLATFAGIRPEEARRIAWEDIREDGIEIRSHKSKTRRRRWIPMSPQMKLWLDAARTANATLPPRNHTKRWIELRNAAGLMADWPANGLRHSFASYHLARFSKENETAAIMGNSPMMIFRHYRAVVHPNQAAEFFDLTPDAAAIKTGMEAEKLRNEAAKLRQNRWRKRTARETITGSTELGTPPRNPSVREPANSLEFPQTLSLGLLQDSPSNENPRAQQAGSDWESPLILQPPEAVSGK